MTIHVRLLIRPTTKKDAEASSLWWSRPGMIRRHADFQSAALPAELPDHVWASLSSSRTETGIPVLGFLGP